MEEKAFGDVVCGVFKSGEVGREGPFPGVALPCLKEPIVDTDAIPAEALFLPPNGERNRDHSGSNSTLCRPASAGENSRRAVSMRRSIRLSATRIMRTKQLLSAPDLTSKHHLTIDGIDDFFHDIEGTKELASFVEILVASH